MPLGRLLLHSLNAFVEVKHPVLRNDVGVEPVEGEGLDLLLADALVHADDKLERVGRDVNCLWPRSGDLLGDGARVFELLEKGEEVGGEVFVP